MEAKKSEVLQGTLDLMILKTLTAWNRCTNRSVRPSQLVRFVGLISSASWSSMIFISNANFVSIGDFKYRSKSRFLFAFKSVRFLFSSTLNSATREILCAKCTLPGGA